MQAWRRGPRTTWQPQSAAAVAQRGRGCPTLRNATPPAAVGPSASAGVRTWRHAPTPRRPRRTSPPRARAPRGCPPPLAGCLRAARRPERAALRGPGGCRRARGRRAVLAPAVGAAGPTTSPPRAVGRRGRPEPASATGLGRRLLTRRRRQGRRRGRAAASWLSRDLTRRRRGGAARAGRRRRASPGAARRRPRRRRRCWRATPR